MDNLCTSNFYVFKSSLFNTDILVTFALYVFNVVLHSVPSGLDDDEVSTERNVAAVSPIPKIITTAIQDDSSRDEEDCRDEWGKSDEDAVSEYHLRFQVCFKSTSDRYILLDSVFKCKYST